MKTPLVLGLLAALYQSVSSLDQGYYQIGSAALSPSLVLSQNIYGTSDPLVFENNSSDGSHN